MRRVIVLAVLVTATLSPTRCWAVGADRTVIETLMGEAGGQGVIGMQAVAEVIRTRARQRHLTPAAVCLQKWQFNFNNDPAYRQNWLRKHGNADLRAQALQAWERSASSNLTQGANNYYAFRLIKAPSYAIGRTYVDLKDHRFFNA